MPVLPAAGASRAQSLVADLAERRRAEQRWLAELAPDVNLDVEANRRMLDPFGLRQTTESPLYDWGKLAATILGGRGGFGPAVPAEKVRAYRQWISQVASKAEPYTPMVGGAWVKRLLQGP